MALKRLTIAGTVRGAGQFKPVLQPIKFVKGDTVIIFVTVKDSTGAIYDIGSGELILTINEGSELFLTKTGDKTETGTASFSISSAETAELEQRDYSYDIVYTEANDICHIVPVSPILVGHKG